MAYNKILAQPISDRFWKYVDRRDEDECWPWLGHIAKPQGYGRISVFFGPGTKPKVAYAHRVSWELAEGPIPDGLAVLHRCDNRPCVNPNHLFIGTQQDNMDDCVSKKRHAHGSKACYAVLREEQVLEIRELYDASGRLKKRGSLKAIAERFGVGLSTVSAAAHYKWKHVGSTIEPPTPLPFSEVVTRQFPGRNGDNNPNAKLTKANVDEMRRRHRDDGLSRSQLAALFGVSNRTVSGILANRNWRSDIAV